VKRFLWPLLVALLAGLVGPVPAAVAVAPQRPSVLPSATVSIAAAANFRDAAGDGLAVAGDGRMATGVVYRSARLYDLTADEIAQLASLGITDVVDLRTPGVAAKAPDPAIAGATHHLISLFAGHTLSTAKVRTAAKARAHMRELNRRFVTVKAQRKALAKVLRAILAAPGPVLIHCTYGKDRTGWVSAMLQVIAGASTEDVVAQYLLSNTYRAEEIQRKIEAARATSGDRRAGVVKELETLRASYLTAGLTKARKRYGSLTRYLTRGVGLTTAELDALRAKLLAS
jgi:protein-tyrosine phosphatase